MGTFILLFTILTIIFLISFIKLINDDSSNYNTNSVTEIINDYKSNKIKEIIIIENQDTTYKYKY